MVTVQRGEYCVCIQLFLAFCLPGCTTIWERDIFAGNILFCLAGLPASSLTYTVIWLSNRELILIKTLLTLAHFGTSICFLLFRLSPLRRPPLLLFPLSIFWLTLSILQQAASAANPRAASMMYIQPSAMNERQQIRAGQLGIFLMLVISKSEGAANRDF